MGGGGGRGGEETTNNQQQQSTNLTGGLPPATVIAAGDDLAYPAGELIPHSPDTSCLLHLLPLFPSSFEGEEIIRPRWGLHLGRVLPFSSHPGVCGGGTRFIVAVDDVRQHAAAAAENTTLLCVPQTLPHNYSFFFVVMTGTAAGSVVVRPVCACSRHTVGWGGVGVLLTNKSKQPQQTNNNRQTSALKRPPNCTEPLCACVPLCSV